MSPSFRPETMENLLAVVTCVSLVFKAEEIEAHLLLDLQTLELIQQERVNLSTKLVEKRISYGKIEDLLSDKFKEQQNWLNSYKSTSKFGQQSLEKKVMEADPRDWQKLCFVPTKSDANVVAFRKWLNKYSSGRINWGNSFDRSLPPSPPREQLMDRYWSHVVNCSSCNAAYKGLKALEVSLQVFSVTSVAIVAATKQGMISVAARNTLVAASIYLIFILFFIYLFY